MIKFEYTEVVGWEAAIRGMRNPMNSWDKSDSFWNYHSCGECNGNSSCIDDFHIGPNDYNLMKRLRNAGTDHRKFMRMIIVYVDITAPLYWWKEFDTYKVGTVANSCSTMHKIAEKEFTLEDFSHENLCLAGKNTLLRIIEALNAVRESYIGDGLPVLKGDKECWYSMIQLLPSSYNQRRTVMLNYEVLANIYKSRKNHKLDEWCEHNPIICVDTFEDGSYSNAGFCDWIKTLPYSALITGEVKKDGDHD